MWPSIVFFSFNSLSLTHSQPPLGLGYTCETSMQQYPYVVFKYYLCRSLLVKSMRSSDLRGGTRQFYHFHQQKHPKNFIHSFRSYLINHKLTNTFLLNTGVQSIRTQKIRTHKILLDFRKLLIHLILVNPYSTPATAARHLKT